MHAIDKLSLPTNKSFAFLKRILGTAKGRPFAAVLLVFLLAANFVTELRPSAFTPPVVVSQIVDFVGAPFSRARVFLFDGYQYLLPRQPKSQPVTIVAIDEKSLNEIGQWPWPRNHLAALINAINKDNPAAIGLDIFMPEADQTSPDRVAANLSPDQKAVINLLQTLPSHDFELAQALEKSPSVLGAVGFDFEAYTTSKGMRTVPLVVKGEDPRPLVRNFPNVLASLPELQAAAHGQALLSVNAQSGAVRHVPLLATIGDQLAPGLSMEMFRVATGSSAVEVTTNKHGVTQVQVADLVVPTQSNGEVWLHFARLESGMSRYVSAHDVLQGRVNADAFSGKLVLLGLTGVGLNDMRTTALDELVPGIEIQAQLIESLFDGDFLLRPWWIKAVETILLIIIGALLIWLVPRSDSRLAAILKSRPKVSLLFILAINIFFLGLGLALFKTYGLLFDSSSFVILFSLVMGVLISSAWIEGLGEARLKLARLIDNGILLGSEKTRDNLLRQTLIGAREIANCAGAVLYLTTERNTVRLAMSTKEELPPAVEWSLYDEDGKPNESFLVQHTVLSGETVVIDDMQNQSRFNKSDTDEICEVAAMQVVSTLNVPLKPREGQVIGLLQLINAVDAQSGDIIPFDPKIIGFVEAMSAQAAVAIENQNLVEAQKDLMDAMIRIIAGAIDAKSPYTGGHCERVPELAIMLAKEACKIKEGALADFEFKTDDEWREFRIGAWLHDCGKVTTPEYVIDKATKLETIFNRIHEIRTRFEVLLRDEQIKRLQAIHEKNEDITEADKRFEARKAELIDDFAFIAECNLGGEFMAHEKIERLQRIATNTWIRHFDDRIGLSSDELLRHEKTIAPPLPVVEQLLSDKPQHLFERMPSKSLDPKYGFQLEVPEYLYNNGEIYNLSVGRGTLTAEERFKINEHIIQTIVMLEQMPLPSNLKRIPEYAGTHHETMVGSGYPRKLSEKDLSIPSRIMALADIFEALTASDRPYKKPKTLSECIKILSFFKKDKHIDPVLFDLFLTSGVYKTYAERFLLPSQIDEVDLEKYLG